MSTSLLLAAALLSAPAHPLLVHEVASNIGVRTASSSAQDSTQERARVLAVADSALLAIARGDMAMLTDLMLPEAVLIPTVTPYDL